MTKNRNMDELNNWLFNYSSHRGAWFAFKREHSVEYLNGNHTNVLKSKSIHTLTELITYHDGDLVKINEVVALST